MTSDLRWTNNTMTKRSVKRQTTMDKTLHTQLNFSQREPHQTQDVKSGTSERQEIHASDIGSL